MALTKLLIETQKETETLNLEEKAGASIQLILLKHKQKEEQLNEEQLNEVQINKVNKQNTELFLYMLCIEFAGRKVIQNLLKRHPQISSMLTSKLLCNVITERVRIREYVNLKNTLLEQMPEIKLLMEKEAIYELVRIITALHNNNFLKKLKQDRLLILIKTKLSKLLEISDSLLVNGQYNAPTSFIEKLLLTQKPETMKNIINILLGVLNSKKNIINDHVKLSEIISEYFLNSQITGLDVSEDVSEKEIYIPNKNLSFLEIDHDFSKYYLYTLKEYLFKESLNNVFMLTDNDFKNTSLLYFLTSSKSGLEILFLLGSNKLANLITTEALCALRKNCNQLYENTSVLYNLCSSSLGREIFLNILNENPKISLMINSKALCALRTRAAGKYANTSSFYYLCFTSSGKKIFNILLNNNKHIVRMITRQPLCTLFPGTHLYNRGTSALYKLCEDPLGRNLFRLLLCLNHGYIANLITREALCGLILNTNNNHFTSSLYWLCTTYDGVAILEQLIEQNKKIGLMIASELNMHIYKNKTRKKEKFSLLYFLCQNPVGERIINMLFNIEKRIKQDPMYAVNIITYGSPEAIKNFAPYFTFRHLKFISVSAQKNILDRFNLFLRYNGHVKEVSYPNQPVKQHLPSIKSANYDNKSTKQSFRNIKSTSNIYPSDSSAIQYKNKFFGFDKYLSRNKNLLYLFIKLKRYFFYDDNLKKITPEDIEKIKKTYNIEPAVKPRFDEYGSLKLLNTRINKITSKNFIYLYLTEITNDDIKNIHYLYKFNIIKEPRTPKNLIRLFHKNIKRKASQEVLWFLNQTLAKYYYALLKNLINSNVNDTVQQADVCSYSLHYACTSKLKRLAKRVLYNFLYNKEEYLTGSKLNKKKVKLWINCFLDEQFNSNTIKKILIHEKNPLLFHKKYKGHFLRIERTIQYNIELRQHEFIQESDRSSFLNIEGSDDSDDYDDSDDNNDDLFDDSLSHTFDYHNITDVIEEHEEELKNYSLNL